MVAKVGREGTRARQTAGEREEEETSLPFGKVLRGKARLEKVN